MSHNFFERVYDVVCQIPAGCVATYGQVARLMGCPHCARQVGFALHANHKPREVPYHRVVNREGRLAQAFVFGGVNVQAEWLKEEGVEVCGDCVDLSRYGWKA